MSEERGAEIKIGWNTTDNWQVMGVADYLHCYKPGA